MKSVLTIEEQKTVKTLLREATPLCQNIRFDYFFVIFTIEDVKYVFDGKDLKCNSFYDFDELEEAITTIETLKELKNKLTLLTTTTIDNFNARKNPIFTKQCKNLQNALQETDKTMSCFFGLRRSDKGLPLLYSCPASRLLLNALKKIATILDIALTRAHEEGA